MVAAIGLPFARNVGASVGPCYLLFGFQTASFVSRLRDKGDGELYKLCGKRSIQRRNKSNESLGDRPVHTGGVFVGSKSEVRVLYMSGNYSCQQC